MLISNELLMKTRVGGSLMLPRSLTTLSELEDLLNTCQLMDDYEGYVSALKLYARKLSDDGQITKASELCHLLLDPNSSVVMNCDGSGFNGKELFRGIYGILAENRAFSRLLVECEGLLRDYENS